MRNLTLLFVTALLACCKSAGPCPQCTPTPCVPDAAPAPTPTPTPVPVVDAAPAPVNDTCNLAEANLLKLGCKDSRGQIIGGPNLHGVKWSQICRSSREAGITMNPTCLAAAKSCKEVEGCR